MFRKQPLLVRVSRSYSSYACMDRVFVLGISAQQTSPLSTMSVTTDVDIDVFTNSILQEVYEPTKKLDPVERQKLVAETTARMKAIIIAKKEKEAEEKSEAEREQRQKTVAPHWDDSSDDDASLGADVDMALSPEAGETEEKSVFSRQRALKERDTATRPENPAPILTDTEIFAGSHASNILRAPAHASKSVPALQVPHVTQKTKAVPPTKIITELPIDTKKKRSIDVMSNSISLKESRDGSPLTEPILTSISSPTSATSTANVSLASLPRIPKRRRSSVSEETFLTSASNLQISQDLGVAPLPEWYSNASPPKNLNQATRTTHRSILDQFNKLKSSIKECVEQPENRKAALKKVTELLHALEFTKIPHEYILFKYKTLHPGQGLKRIADFQDSGYKFPWYLRADAQELYNKWLSKQWDPDMFRGIKNMVKGVTKGKGQSIDERHKLDWRFFGEGNFVAGQWWATQLCAVRDGAHGSAQAGIAGIKTTETRPGGATSIVLSEGHKEDIDEGEEIWYCGTEAKMGDTEPTTSTKLMLESVATGQPVRVMRSSHLPAGNKYKPMKGIRYDGLYKVLSSEVISDVRHHYLFHLKRIPGQINLRCEGEAARPTPRELQEYESEMKKYGRRGSLD